MKGVFVDTSHLVATLNPRDSLHDKAFRIETDLRNIPLVTSDFVLLEVCNYFSEFSRHIKDQISNSVDAIIRNPRYSVIESSRFLFLSGKGLYSRRTDHGYSLTDCISMTIMFETGITEILTNDNHFEHEGFRILL
jgi:predicted nucleic acid-binding protein